MIQRDWRPADYYLQDKATNCWVRPHPQGFSYSDGDEVEARLLRIVQSANDLSAVSAELRRSISDWPSAYHLHPRRSNLLRPLNRFLQGRILEIGAGCGAVTRYLGEQGAIVHAVEGSSRRAVIASARCRDLRNVAVIVDSFDSLQAPAASYDVVTAIGVLEYSRLFSSPKSGLDAFDAMLARARSFLKPEGVLIIAIENQLGLKYFAGYCEDHLGQPMAGIEDRYSERGVVTFGRQELERRIDAAGLSFRQWWFPFPDYKLPTLLISQEWIETAPMIDVGPLVSDALVEDGQNPAFLAFSLEQASQVVSRNGLLGELANSFLVAASAHEIKTLPKVIGYQYDVDYRAEFTREIRYECQHGLCFMHKSRMAVGAYANQHGPAELHLLEREKLIRGQFWHQEFYRIVNRPGWDVQDMVEWTRAWLIALLHRIGRSMSGVLSASADVPGDLLGAMPRTLIRDNSGAFHFCGQELKSVSSVELGYLVTRAVLSSLLRLRSCASPSTLTPLRCGELFRAVTGGTGVSMSEQDLQRYIEMENNLCLWLSGQNPGLALDRVDQRTLPVRPPLY